jgi:pyruvate/2-oxoglutarate dehydrogenase complex dihydrolipoamide acyltransferase (E2) component
MSDTLVRMPKLADTLVEGTLGRWLKRAGDNVAQGEALASIETDKVTTDLTAPATGTLLEILVDEGQTVPIETPIARIGEQARVGEQVRVADQAPVSAPRRKVTPVAARLLSDHGVTPDQIPARSGRVTKQDVLTFIGSAGSPPEAPRELSSMRRAIAEHMTRSWQTIPHGQTVMEVDLTRLVAWRDARRSDSEVNITFTVLFIYALARALAAYTGKPADLGVAVALDRGLIVPVLRAAESLSLRDTAQALNDLASRARGNQLRPDDVQGGTMTLTNVGSFGNVTAAPIVPLGQLGILGPGLVERRPLPTRDGGIRPGWRCMLSFVFNRREFEDFAADRFLTRVVAELTAIADG